MFVFHDKVELASVNRSIPVDNLTQKLSIYYSAAFQFRTEDCFFYVKKEQAAMFVRIALCLLAVLTGGRYISAQGGEFIGEVYITL
jgi:hypothetical protein